MGKNDKEYDIERELEDMKDLLKTEDITCPNCSSSVSPDAEKCSVCGYSMSKPDDDEGFENKLKATMWAPGMERGVPLGNELPKPQVSGPKAGEEDVPEVPEEELLDFLKEDGPSEEEELIKEAFSAKERMKLTLSVTVVIFGIVFYVLTAIYHEIGVGVLALMVIGTILVLIGGNLAFDLILDRKKKAAISSKTTIGDTLPSLKGKLLSPGDRFAKVFWSIITIVGVLSYVLLPILSTDDILRFVGMGTGSVLIVLGISSAYIAFFHQHPVREKKGEHVYEAFIEEEKEEFEWACPVCNTPLSEDLDYCPECGAEFED
jgi:RNA polymerase subunit RPABC4/transcription elongation factor Spt4